MVQILTRNKALSVNPLKTSAPMGAALAFLGLARCVPMLHGSQGCTAFGKVFFVRHFREPIPLQTSAMDQVSTVMSADDNVIEGLRVICEKSQPEIIGLPTTGLSETQGVDIRRVVAEFRTQYPQYAAVAVVPVATPDYTGCLETGFAQALTAIIETLVPETAHAGRRHRQVNVLAGSALTPGDIEAVKAWCASFCLRPVVLPDIGDALDGHLIESEFTPLTLGGTPRSEIATLGESCATLVIGRSLKTAADALKARTGVPDYRFDHLMGQDACDAFTAALAEISGAAVPECIERQRAQLQDAMVDCHFMTGFTRTALAGDPDLVSGFAHFLHGMGCEVVACVSAVNAEVLADLPCEQVKIGDLEDLEHAARAAHAELVISNSHAAQCAQRLGVPLLRAGFPLYDRVGAYARTWVGYAGSRQTLFEFANLVLSQHHEITPYRSVFWAGGARDRETQHGATHVTDLVG